MSEYLLDTGPLAGYLLRRPRFLLALRQPVESLPTCTSVLVYGEVTEYLMGLRDSVARRGQLRELLAVIPPLLPTPSVMERYADLRRHLRSTSRGLVGDIDTAIAATAIEHGLTPITMDRDFERVLGLALQIVVR